MRRLSMYEAQYGSGKLKIELCERGCGKILWIVTDISNMEDLMPRSEKRDIHFKGLCISH